MFFNVTSFLPQNNNLLIYICSNYYKQDQGNSAVGREKVGEFFCILMGLE